ncbi:hypothetical protein ZOSMA_216G00340 [Zostera marina]|uniref:Uncharacterized protein n=1 Tax=Zostera marina TaxID=29655 RepID=A0A0K9PJY1_ZOSMR|nr:hypothetical protein ZOSMA_216G00340 [Zostera marina]
MVKDFYELDCVKSHNYAAKLFNLQINTMCSTLQADLSGFKNSKLACCGGSGGSQLYYNSEIPCGKAKIIDGNEIISGVCKNVNSYINWDVVHYTETVNSL